VRVFYAKYRGLKRNPLVFEPHAAPLGERYSYVPDCLRRTSASELSQLESPVFEPHAPTLGERYSYVSDCFRRYICV